MEEIVSCCYERIVQLKRVGRPTIIAITGDSGSGKSFFSRLLQKKFDALGLNYSHINHDEFLIARKDREPMKRMVYKTGPYEGRSYWEVLENMFRLDEYERAVLLLQSGSDAAFYPYERSTGEVSDTKRIVHSADYIIMDTSMLHSLADIVILIDVEQDTTIKRKLARDSDVRTPEEIIKMHKMVQGRYWIDRGMPVNPDIVIDNNDPESVRIKKA